jgi:hypothetical protein
MVQASASSASRKDGAADLQKEDTKMSNRKRTLVAAALTLASLSGPAAASEIVHNAGFTTPPVSGAAYFDHSIATGASEVRRQGGFSSPAGVRWLPRNPEAIEPTPAALHAAAF